jgi:hypothetical protein
VLPALPYIPSLPYSIVSTASAHCPICCSRCWRIMSCACADWRSIDAICASRFFRSAVASHAPTLRADTVIVMSPCGLVMRIVPLYSVRAALYVFSMCIFPCGQLTVIDILLPDCFWSEILHASLCCPGTACFFGSLSWHTCCVDAPMPLGMPGTFMVTSHSSPSCAANTASGNESMAASASRLDFMFPVSLEACYGWLLAKHTDKFWTYPSLLQPLTGWRGRSNLSRWTP